MSSWLFLNLNMRAGFSSQNEDKESVKIVVNMGGKEERLTVKSG